MRWQFFLFINLLACVHLSLCGKDLTVEPKDLKDFKKLVKGKKNVLVAFHKDDKQISLLKPDLISVAQNIVGVGVIALISCSTKEGRKVCKKFKADPTSSVVLKHFLSGQFHKDYDRQLRVKSLLAFLKDPTGDIPWDEDEAASNVVHLRNQADFLKILRKKPKQFLVVFYAPWCGYCKKLKPGFAAAATTLKKNAVLAGMDVDKPEGTWAKMQFNITGYPTILYFERGELKFPFGGESTREGIVSWLENPRPRQKEKTWEEESEGVVFLKEDTFDSFVTANPSVLVMFYAPWCGHCKAMKPEYESAAKMLKEEKVGGVVAAVDGSAQTSLAKRFGISGYPTLKYFRKGEFAWDVNERKKEGVLRFMRNPVEPPPPPPPETPWTEVESEVHHLTDDDFANFLKRKKHALVMFYAPWCGHCKKAKPEFQNAAEQFKDDLKVAFVAVDCTENQVICKEYAITAYPKFSYFFYGRNVESYNAERKEKSFVEFLRGKGGTITSSDKDEAQSDSLLRIDELQLQDAVRQYPNLFVMFQSSACDHCAAMRSTFTSVVSILEREKLDITLAVVISNSAEDFAFSGHPTMQYFRSGALKQVYKGERTADAIISYLKAEMSSADGAVGTEGVRHLVLSTFRSVLLSQARTLVLFYTASCSASDRALSVFQETLPFLSEGSFLADVKCNEEKALCGNLGIKKFPSVRLFSGDKFLQEYSETLDRPHLVNFISSLSRAQSNVKKSKTEL